MDRHVSILSGHTVAQAAQTAQALQQALTGLPSTIEGAVQAVWSANGDPTPTSLWLLPAKTLTAHGVLAIANHQEAILQAVAAWGKQCPLLWADRPLIKPQGTTNDTMLGLTFVKGKATNLRLYLDNPLQRRSNVIESPIGAKGLELVRFATFLACVQEPLQAWTSKTGQKEEHYYAGDHGTAALIDRLVRSARTVLKTGKANTPAGMSYSVSTVPVDAQAVMDHLLKG